MLILTARGYLVVSRTRWQGKMTKKKRYVKVRTPIKAVIIRLFYFAMLNIPIYGAFYSMDKLDLFEETEDCDYHYKEILER